MRGINRDCPQWRIDRWNRIDAVRHFVQSLTDRDMMTAAFLMMQGMKSEKIMQTMKIDRERFNAIRECLAFGLLFAGVAVRD